MEYTGRTIRMDLETGDWLEYPARGISFEEGVRVADSALPGYDIPAML